MLFFNINFPAAFVLHMDVQPGGNRRKYFHIKRIGDVPDAGLREKHNSTFLLHPRTLNGLSGGCILPVAGIHVFNPLPQPVLYPVS